MIVIGVLAPGNSFKIVNHLKRFFKRNNKRVAVIKGVNTHESELLGLMNIGTDYCIIIFNTVHICPHYVDILILDNMKNEKIVSYDLIKCISPNTRLVYNIDNDYLPFIEHPYAIDYGLRRNATVTISSIDDKIDGMNFFFCLQKPISTLFNTQHDEGEVFVSAGFEKSDVSNILPTITCGILCGLLEEDTVKL